MAEASVLLPAFDGSGIVPEIKTITAILFING
jgi:hypothetical protein